MVLERLDEMYKGKKTLFDYSTDFYYDIKTREESGNIIFFLEKKSFEKTLKKQFESILLEDHYSNPVLYGMKDGENLVGFIEIASEDWSNRARITNVLVANDYRGQGIGKQLLDKALEHARNEKRRAVVLETQTCNYPAIQFYKSAGFDIIGFDLSHYSNEDLDNKEVRIEMGKTIEPLEPAQALINEKLSNTKFITF